ncbi:MAG: hypothetical protein K2O06_07215 [Acetatifactor sp.]|nr:hypothetical protein [Acetatifactor sp.]
MPQDFNTSSKLNASSDLDISPDLDVSPDLNISSAPNASPDLDASSVLEQTSDKLLIHGNHITVFDNSLHISGTYYIQKHGKKNFKKKRDKIIVPFSSVLDVSEAQNDHPGKKALSLLLFLIYACGALVSGKFGLNSLLRPTGPAGDSLWLFVFITAFLAAMAVICLLRFLRLPGLPRRLFVLHQAETDLAFDLRRCDPENVSRLEQLLKKGPGAD